MNFKILLAASAASLSLAGGLAAPAYAQETTSSIAGQVSSEAGAPVAAAKVSVTHVPSGTTSSATTDASGNFSLRGLRVGGPYTVKVTARDYAVETVSDIALTVGDTLALPVRLSTHEIVVTAAASKGSRALVTGSQSTFRAADIINIVSARRDVRDIMRRDIL